MFARFTISAFTFVLALSGAAPSSGQIAVIANPSVPDDSMSKSKIVDLFTGDVRLWANGQPVVPLDLQSPKEVRKDFYKALGKSSSRMRSIWMKKKLSGEGDVPESVETEDEVVAKVAATPGSISFVRTAHATSSVKVLRILQAP